MIFMWAEKPYSVVFFAALKPHTTFGDLMKKSATLITTALLTFGFAAASMAADAPSAGTPAAAGSTTPAPKAKTHKASSKKHKKSTSGSSTSK